MTVVTILVGTFYISFQQSGRQHANVAPAAAAEAQLQWLGSTTAPNGPRAELSPNSGVFVVVYRSDDQPESGTATLHGQLPAVPDGVLDTARSTGVDTVTWQPEPGLRMAIVARSLGGEVVVAGQSLSPYEATDATIMLYMGLGWLACFLVLGSGVTASLLIRRRQPVPLAAAGGVPIKVIPTRRRVTGG